MSGSMNQVTLIGNLGADPEVRQFNNGGSVCNLRIATSESWKDKNTGEKKTVTQWHSIAIFVPGLVSIASEYLAKGSKVMIQGQLETRKWQDKEGNDRYSTEVCMRPFNSKLVILSFKDDSDNSAGAAKNENKGMISDGDGGYKLDDEIPF